MRFRLWEIITYVVLIVLTIIFGVMKVVWHGFSYFSAVLLLAILVLFIINRCFYIKEIKIDYDENLDIFFAELLNNGQITKEQFNARDEKVVKKNYKEFYRIRKIQILFIIFLCAIVLTISLFLIGVI